MYLTETKLMEIAKKQFKFKLSAHFGIFTALIFAQILAFMFSLSGTGTSGFGTGEISINTKYYTGNIVIFFTMIWAFTTGISMTTKAFKDGDFSFVSNRLSSHLSSIALLLTASFLGGITAMLSGSLLKVVMYYAIKREGIMEFTYYLPISDLLLGIFTAILYVTLLSALGYVVGTIVQLHKAFLLLLPGLFFGLLFAEARTQGNGLLAGAVKLFAGETSFMLFLLKASLVITGLFYIAITISNQVEVRR